MCGERAVEVMDHAANARPIAEQLTRIDRNRPRLHVHAR